MASVDLVGPCVDLPGLNLEEWWHVGANHDLLFVSQLASAIKLPLTLQQFVSVRAKGLFQAHGHFR
ncbi:MAG: hypothetical protein OXN97_02360 [Bryobacterales bacterium]|nr:hypothetical protein [Bryobacterales bacterium]